MSDLNKKKRCLESEERKWEIEKEIITRKQKIKNEKKELTSSNKKKTTTTKLFLLFLFMSCICIEIYTGVITWKMLNLVATTGYMTMDFSPLLALIGAVVGEVVGYAIYAVKSAKENSVGGITYDMAMFEKQNNNNETKG